MSFCSVKRIILLLLFCVSAIPLFAAPGERADRIRSLLPSVLKIKIQRSSNETETDELIAFEGGGSGFVFDPDHHVITNAHVVKGAKKIVVIDLNRTEYPAELVGSDEKTDIAILSVPALDAPALPFGEPKEISIGEEVLIIGSPFSLGHSVSAGIISMTERFLPDYPYTRLIQTDAAINPGNSGGALFNSRFEVIGMASIYYTNKGGYTNIGFAIPVDTIQRIGTDLIEHGRIVRGYLGITTVYSEAISRKMGYPHALLISEVQPDSPASEAGIRRGDLITGINGESIEEGGEFYRMIERSREGDELHLDLVRNRSKQAIRLTYAPSHEQKLHPHCNTSSNDASEKMGLIVCELNEILSVVDAFGNAKNVGVDAGDILVGINGQSVNSLKELNGFLAQLRPNEIALLTLHRAGESLTLPLGSEKALQIHRHED